MATHYAMRKLHQLILECVHFQERATHAKNLASHPDSLRFACGAPKTEPTHSEGISCPFDCKMVKAYMSKVNLTVHANGEKTIAGLTDVKVWLHQEQYICFWLDCLF